jgi:hypothetical protein
MALTGSIALTGVPGPAANPFSQSSVTGTLTLSNTGTGAVYLQSVSAWFSGVGQQATPIYANPNVWIPTELLTVQPGSTVSLLLSWGQYSPPAVGNGIAQSAVCGATVYSSDPTNPVLNPVAQYLANTPDVPISPGGQGGAAVTSPAQGGIRYDLSFSTPWMFLW